MVETETRPKKRIQSKSGWCGHDGGSPEVHRFCWEKWETPSALVMCPCECHQRSAEERKIVPKVMKRKIVAKG